MRTTSRRSIARWPHRPCKDRIVVEDLPLELLQTGARLEPEVVGEPAPTCLVGGERLSLAAGAIERPHELCERSLAVRVLVDQLLELRHELGAPPE
jgi:hypothetical protein